MILETKNVIYLYANKLNGHQYVGQSVDFKRRHYRHCKGYDKDHSLIDKAIQKYSIENFEWRILESVPHLKGIFLKNYLNKLEIYYIDTLKPHYNMSKGGDFNPMDSPSVRKRHKEIMGSIKERLKRPRFTSENNPMKDPEIVNKYFKGDKNPSKRYDVRLKIAKNKSTTGILYLRKKSNKQCKQGFTWYYNNSQKNIYLSSTKLQKLLNKLKSENIDLVILDEEKAKLTFEEGGVSL